MAARGSTAKIELSERRLILEGQGYLWKQGDPLRALHFHGLESCIGLVVSGMDTHGTTVMAAALHVDSPALAPVTVKNIINIFRQAPHEGRLTNFEVTLLGGDPPIAGFSLVGLLPMIGLSSGSSESIVRPLTHFLETETIQVRNMLKTNPRAAAFVEFDILKREFTVEERCLDAFPPSAPATLEKKGAHLMKGLPIPLQVKYNTRMHDLKPQLNPLGYNIYGSGESHLLSVSGTPQIPQVVSYITGFAADAREVVGPPPEPGCCTIFYRSLFGGGRRGPEVDGRHLE